MRGELLSMAASWGAVIVEAHSLSELQGTVELPVGLLQVIDLGDEMEFERLPGATRDELTCNVADVPTDDSNLVIKVRPLGSGALGTWGAHTPHRHTHM